MDHHVTLYLSTFIYLFCKNKIYQYIIFRTEFKIVGYLNLASKKIMISAVTCVKHIEKRDKFPYGYFVQNKCLKFKWDELFCFEYGHFVHCFLVRFVDRILLGGLEVQITCRERGGLGKYYSKTCVNAVMKSCHYVLSMVLKVLFNWTLTCHYVLFSHALAIYSWRRYPLLLILRADAQDFCIDNLSKVFMSFCTTLNFSFIVFRIFWDHKKYDWENDKRNGKPAKTNGLSWESKTAGGKQRLSWL